METTDHALERFKENHPDGDFQFMCSLFSHGIEIDSQMAGTLTASNRRRTAKDTRFVLAPDYSGLFVYTDGVIVTFLRFGMAQMQLCERLWGRLGGEPDAHPPPPPAPPIKKASPVVEIPPNPNSLKAFYIWIKENLGITESVSFPFEMTNERKRELAHYMKTTPCTNPSPYDWVWEKVSMVRDRCRYRVIEK